MTKRVVIVAFILLSLILSMPAAVFATESNNGASVMFAAQTTEALLLNAYRSYYDTLLMAIDEYGIGRSLVALEDYAEYAFEAPTGVYYAELIDFGNTGLPALLYIYDDGTMFSFMFGSHCNVYGYNNRLESWFAGDIGSEGGYGSYISIETGRNGLKYMNHQEYHMGDERIVETYYTVENREWIVSLERVYEDGFDYSSGTNTGERWFVNNNPANERAYNSAPESLLGINVTRDLPTPWQSSGNADTVYAVLAELEAKIAELERNPSPGSDEYDYNPQTPGGGFSVRPELWRRITDAPSANEAINEAIASMTPEQRSSGDALDITALFIENAVRAGARWTAAGEVSLSAGVLGDLAGTARGILASADSTLSQENVGLLRKLRTNLSIRTEETESLVVSFQDDVSGVAFDNVTVEAEFASVTLSRSSILSGGRVEVRKGADWADKGQSGDGSGSSGSGNQDSTSGNGSGNGSSSGSGDGRNSANRNGDAGFFENTKPLDFWSAGVVVLILGLWGVLAALKHRFRAWVVPTFCALAIGINACTFFLINDSSTRTPDNGHTDTPNNGGSTQSGGGGGTGQNDGGKNGQNDGTGTSQARIAGSIEVIMSEGVRATVSLPAEGGERDYLVLLNEDGIPQYSKYNPVTDMIDTRIRESGVYTLKEYAVSFIDVEQKNELMKEAISQLASRGIMTGTTDGFFFPDKPITRAELVSAIVRAFDLVDPDAMSTFTDLNRSDWYYSAVASAQREGIVDGFADNTFRGDVDIPKDQLVVVTANTLIERMGYIVPGEIEELLAVFLDRGSIAEWSEGRVALAAQSNILIYRTDSLFAPRSIMTRGDAAIILFRVFNKVW